MVAGIAVLSTEVGTQEDGWRQLLPEGRFRAIDGRPFDVEEGWLLNEAIANKLIKKVSLKQQDLMLDYEHQSLRAEDNGQPVPASGWFDNNELKWVKGKGLYIRPRWTSKAKAMLDAKEYRYLSAVFPYDKNGHPLDLISVALTNDPALTGMDELTKIAALKAQYQQDQSDSNKGDNSMNEYLSRIFAALNIEDVEDDLEAATLLAIEKIDELQVKETEVADLNRKLSISNPDPRKYVPRSQFDALGTQVAALTKQMNGNEVERVLSEAKAQGNIIEAEIENLTEIGETYGVAALKKALEKRPRIAALTDASDVIDEAVDAVERVLTEEELIVAKNMGLDTAEFLAYLIENERDEEDEA